MRAFEFVDASSPEKALAHLGDRSERRFLKGGGIDILDLAREGVVEPARLVSLLSAKLSAIEVGAEGARIGATATLASLASHADLAARYPAISQAALGAATPQVRNRATVAGNLCQRPRCWYFRNAAISCLKKGGDSCPAVEGENEFHAIFDTSPCPAVHASNLATAMLALDATFVVLGPGGERRVSAAEFFVAPSVSVERENVLGADEILTRVELAAPAPAGRSLYLEVRHKASFDWALVAVAASAVVRSGALEAPRIVLGAVGPIPRRAREAEEVVAGERLTPDLAAKAAEKAFAAATPLSKNAYKVRLGRTLLSDLLLELVK